MNASFEIEAALVVYDDFASGIFTHPYWIKSFKLVRINDNLFWKANMVVGCIGDREGYPSYEDALKAIDKNIHIINYVFYRDRGGDVADLTFSYEEFPL